MPETRTRLLVEAALTLALAAALNRLAPLQMPFGGSVSLDMLPLIVFAVRNGLMVGMGVGAAFGFVDYMMEPFFVHPVQLVLDYPLAFGLVGLAGLASYAWRGALASGRPGSGTAWALLAGALGIAARFASHYVSGIVFFAEYAPEGQPVWLYSAIYNASYMLPSAVVTLAAAALVLPALQRVVPVRRPRLS